MIRFVGRFTIAHLQHLSATITVHHVGTKKNIVKSVTNVVIVIRVMLVATIYALILVRDEILHHSYIIDSKERTFV